MSFGDMGENADGKKRQRIKPGSVQELIAWETLRMPDAVAAVMGGPNKAEARRLIESLGYRIKETPEERDRRGTR
jgi:hypothetical protein